MRTNIYSAWTKHWNDNGVTVHHLHVSVSWIYRNARFIWNTGNTNSLKSTSRLMQAQNVKKWSGVTSSCLNFADTFWNWRVRIFNVIYWNIGPYLENVVIKLIPRIYCCRNILQLNFNFQPYIFNDVQLRTLGRSFHDFDFVSIHEWFCYPSSMNRSIVILTTIIIIWEVPGNDWPQTTVQDFNIFCCIYCSINFSQKVPTPLYVMQPQIMTTASVM